MPKHLDVTLTNEIEQSFQITSRETFYDCCKIALQFFKQHPDTKKIRRKDWSTLFPDAPITSCSFLNNKDNNHPEYGIYALSREIIGKGASGKVKLGLRIDEPGHGLLTIKIQAPQDENTLKFLQSEITIGKQQGFFREDALFRKEKNKYYFVAPHNGITLTKWLKSPRESTVRLHVAIQLAIRIHNLHIGTQNCPPTAHRDIKTDNVLISNNEKITLIDYGYSTTDIHAPDPGICGTPTYLPLNLDRLTPTTSKDELGKLMSFTKHRGLLQLDCYALKRILMIPSNLGFSLLDTTIINNIPPIFAEMLNTEDTQHEIYKPNQSASEIAARLILFAYRVYSNKIIDFRAQQQIINIYSDLNTNETDKPNLFTNILQQANACLTRNMSYDSLNRPSTDSFFSQGLNTCSSPSPAQFFEEVISQTTSMNEESTTSASPALFLQG